jgi:hypothetical protein
VVVWISKSQPFSAQKKGPAVMPGLSAFFMRLIAVALLNLQQAVMADSNGRRNTSFFH